MKAYDYSPVTAIYGTAEYDWYPTRGYHVRDAYGRALGYVAREGRTWKAVRPREFGTFGGFHRERRLLAGSFTTRRDATRHLQDLADAIEVGE